MPRASQITSRMAMSKPIVMMVWVMSAATLWSDDRTLSMLRIFLLPSAGYTPCHTPRLPERLLYGDRARKMQDNHCKVKQQGSFLQILV